MTARSRNNTGPQPTVTPPPIIEVDSDEVMHTLVAAQMDKHREHGGNAVLAERDVASLDAEIAKLRGQIEQKMGERQRKDALARQYRKTEDGFARVVAGLGLPYPQATNTPPVSAPLTPEQMPGRQVHPPALPAPANGANPYPSPIEQEAMQATRGFEPFRPPDTQVLPDPDGPLAKFNEAHDEQDATESVVTL